MLNFVAHPVEGSVRLPPLAVLRPTRNNLVNEPALSKRERQIMDVIFRLGEASAADVHERLPEAPSYTAVRTMLRLLEDKGMVVHRQNSRAKGRDSADGPAAVRGFTRAEVINFGRKSNSTAIRL